MKLERIGGKVLHVGAVLPLKSFPVSSLVKLYELSALSFIEILDDLSLKVRLPAHTAQTYVPGLSYATRDVQDAVRTRPLNHRSFAFHQLESIGSKDRSKNYCRMLRDGSIVPFGQQIIEYDFQVVLDFIGGIAAGFVESP
ncbi:MAG: hypothetical protein HQ581_06440, partial [Planctomycetes bacterium]|nr:hypothetical protein [Planctomycetota bacterium]